VKIPQSKIEANWSGGSCVMIGEKNGKTENTLGTVLVFAHGQIYFKMSQNVKHKEKRKSSLLL